jgi:hypothetical protein
MWQSSKQKTVSTSTTEAELLQVKEYIGQGMVWRIIPLKVVYSLYRPSYFSANITTGLMNYVYRPGFPYSNVTGDFLNE